MFVVPFSANAGLYKDGTPYETYVLSFESNAMIKFVIAAEFPACKGISDFDGEILTTQNGSQPTSLLVASMSMTATYGVCNPFQDPAIGPKAKFTSKVFSVPTAKGHDGEVRILVPRGMTIELVN